MSRHSRFHLRTLDDLARLAQSLGVEIPAQEDLSPLSRPLDIGAATLPNRFAAHPMEGFDSDENGGPAELAFRRYRRYAEGGYGLIWFEATAVLFEARSNARQLWIHDGNVEQFKELVATTRQAAADAFGAAHRPVLILQITHSGRYSRPHGVPAPIIAHHSEVLDPLHKLPPDYPVVTDEYLDALQDRFVEAAKLAREAGFDGVDVKSCHRYLFAELYASFTRENSRYGGSFENRTRMTRETVGRIRDRVPGLFVTTRMNVYDAIPYPWGWGVDKDDFMKPDLSEPLRLAGHLAESGVPILNASIANPYYNPHFGRPYDHPVAGAEPPDEQPLEGVARFLEITGRMQRAFPDLPVVGSGYSWLRHLLPHVAAAAIEGGGASVLGLGRSSFAYPDAPKDIMQRGGMEPSKCCITCSACTQIMRDGGRTGCVVRDSAVYAEEYRQARRMAPDRLAAEAARCRDCEAPTCQAACPALVDVPGFVKAFAEGDLDRAYDILSADNCLPEMCAYVCPAEAQCEGGCLEALFTENPVAIRDIPRAGAAAARRSGRAAAPLGVPTGKRAAVLGAGPAGLACAVRLAEVGHSVDIHDAAESPGGVPETMIPGERLPRSVAKAEAEAVLSNALAEKRVRFRFGSGLSPERTLDSFLEEYDAVFLGMGLGESVGLPGATARPVEVVDSLAFLREAKAGRMSVPARVAVLGGGNTAMDAACAAARLGAQDVYVVYRRSFKEMPAWPSERDEALRLGAHFLVLTQPLDYDTRQGRLTGLKIARTTLGEPDASGRRTPAMVPESEHVLPVELVVEALGQAPPPWMADALPGVEMSPQGRVVVDPATQATSREAVFAGGDLVNGGDTAVRAVAEGMSAAKAMDDLLAAGSRKGGQRPLGPPVTSP